MSSPWDDASRAILEKMLGEFSYERLLVPAATGAGEWRLDLPSGVCYRFRAHRGAFESWFVKRGTVTRQGADGPPHRASDPRRLIVDARSVLGLAGARLADVLSELTATVAAEAQRLAGAPSVAQLLTMDYDMADGHLTGHPRLVLNKGRVGFSGPDRRHYAPEARTPFPLRWVAVHQRLADFRSIAALPRDTLLAEELDPATVAEFERVLATVGPVTDYVWLPVHPWQWDEVVSTLYAAEVASGQVVLLGDSADDYLPHQTVRTLANVSHPERRDVKTAVSVRNTLVYRGLASAATLAGPATTEWLIGLHHSDPLLSHEYRFDLLGEVAAASVRHPLFGSLDELPYRYHETLGVLWREPLRSKVAAGEYALSMAALPYRDPAGASVLAHLVRESGMDGEAWLHRLFDLLLTPLLHWLYRYGVGFCPHGQNLILVLDQDYRPARLLIKDFAQGVDLTDTRLPDHADLAPEADAEILRWPAALLAQSLHSSVTGGQFRFLAEIARDDLGVERTRFWDRVRQVVRCYGARFPELVGRYPDLDLFEPDIERVCLNREHLGGEGFDRVDRDEEFDVRFGRVPNPLHRPDPGGAW